jgi:hypothetical protein
MMKRFDIGLSLVVCFAAMISGAVIRPASAISGNSIEEMCRTMPELAAMYATGVSDAHAIAESEFKIIRESLGRGREAKFIEDMKNVETILLGHYCVPDGVTVRQIGDVFCKFLRENPERREYMASFLFPAAMSKAWPCSK